MRNEIIKRKGYTSYALGLAVTDIIKAILCPQKRIHFQVSQFSEWYLRYSVCLFRFTHSCQRGRDTQNS